MMKYEDLSLLSTENMQILCEYLTYFQIKGFHIIYLAIMSLYLLLIMLCIKYSFNQSDLYVFINLAF